MPEENSRVHWERVSKTWWSAAVGTVRQEKGVWTGFVYRNTRTGESWTESKTGFATALAAMRWVDYGNGGSGGRCFPPSGWSLCSC